MWLFVPPKDMTSFAASAFAPVSEDWISELASLNPDITLFVMSSETASPRPLSWPGWQTRPWLRLLSGTISNPSTAARGVAEFISSLPVIPVSPSPTPASARERTTRATSGPMLHASSTKSAPDDVSSRTSPAICPLASTMSAETFKAWAMGLQRASYLRRKSAGLTCESDFSFWPTPTYRMGGNRVSVEVAPGRFRFHADENITGKQVGLKNATVAWTILWDMLGLTGRDPRRVVSSLRCRVTLYPGDAHLKGRAILQINPAFTDWMMGWPSGWTAPLRPVTEWSQWQQRARGGG